MKKKIVKLLLIIILIFSLVSSVKAISPICEKMILDEWDIKEYVSRLNNNELSGTNEIPEKYDLRDSIDIVVKNQFNTNACWTFASNSALETYLAKIYKESLDFSERHMLYSTAFNFLDGENEYGHNREAFDSGNARIAMAYFMSGRGPVKEEDMHFQTDNNRIMLSLIKGLKVQKRLTSYVEFPIILKDNSSSTLEYINTTNREDESFYVYSQQEVQTIRNAIKNHIKQYGAVITSTVSNQEFFNYDNPDGYPAYYCNDISLAPNHAIAIIGWDDNYSIDNFNENYKPNNKGAYLVLNSYGLNDKYPYGCYYISYEDTFIENGIVGITGVTDIDYDNIYQYDYLGVSSSIEPSLNDITSMFGANVFYRNISERPVEELNSISIESLVNEKVKVYVNKDDNLINIQQMQEVELENDEIQNGATTIYFKNPILLTGKTFAIVVEYINEEKNPSIGIENKSAKYWQTANAEEGESYCSFNGITNWIDINTESFPGYTKKPNICIKSYTNTVLNPKDYEMDEYYIYKIEPKTKVSEFIQKTNAKIDIILLNSTRQILNSNDILYTGCIMVLEDGTEYLVAVQGDLDSNGFLNENDIQKIENYLVNLNELSELEKKAADYSLDEDISITDYVQMLKQAGIIEEKR